MNDLLYREQRFHALCNRFEHIKVGRMAAAFKIPSELYQTLRQTTMQLMSSCLDKQNNITNEKELISLLDNSPDCLSNRTPNGKIMPKPHLSLDYNRYIRSVREIINGMGIDDLIDSYRIPSCRYKTGDISDELLNRAYATEKLHTETWLGHPENTVIFHIPILGDIENNFVKLYDFPDEYKEEWSYPSDDFNNHLPLAKKFTEISHTPSPGYLYIFDGAGVHATTRNHGALGRVSLELFMLLKNKIPQPGRPAHITNKLFDMEVTPEEFASIGNEKIIHFKDTLSGAIEADKISKMGSMN